jgi:hypothetical protein
MRPQTSSPAVLRRYALAVAFVTLPLAASAQGAGQVRGVVRDSASGGPVAGAVVVAYGDGRGAVARTLTDEAGRYRLVPTAAPQSLRVMRIGFRPREVMVPTGGPDRVLDVVLTTIPTLLERVQVVAGASGCPRAPDAARAGGLLDQARAALLATVVAREAAPATVTRTMFERRMDANGERIESQRVRLETAERATVSFNAVQPASDLAARGFSAVEEGRRAFYGPDADVLLDDGFARAYCFSLAVRDSARPGLAGIAFAPASTREGRVDIRGTLWVDTIARRLSHVEFRYLGVDRLSEGFGAGGRVAFREVVPGIVMIDRWSLRLVGGLAPDALASAEPAIARAYEISEVGGELAEARWPDGRLWRSSLGTLRLTATTSTGDVAAGIAVELAGTSYAATTDSAGRAEFRRLVPGPYTLAVTEARLATIGLTVPTQLVFTAVRDSVHAATVVLPTSEEFVRSLCPRGGRETDNSALLIGRVGDADGAPALNARWSIARGGQSGWTTVSEGRSTAGGLFALCRGLQRGETVQVKAWRDREAPAVSVRVLADALTVIPVRLPAAGAARARGGTTALLRGAVRDSSTGATVPGAFVELVGTARSAISDSAGTFSLGAVAPGDYTAEVRTALLDSLGAVGRLTFTLTGAGAPVNLFVPAPREIVVAMCGPALTAGAGVVIGEVRAPSDGVSPAGVRVVAEWSDELPAPGSAPPRLQWLRTRADANGRFRLCGVPARTALTLRAQPDSGSTLAARPRAVRVDSGRVFAHAEVMLEAGLVVGAAFTGVVVADTGEGTLAGAEPGVAGAEVSLPGISRVAVTNADGTFRINDLPPGVHQVTIRRAGFIPITADVGFVQNHTVEQRIVLGREAAALLAVTVVNAPTVNPEFDQNRRLGLGKFLTRVEFDKLAGRKLGDVIAMVPSLGVTAQQGTGGHAWIVGRRIATKLSPHIGELPAGAAGATDPSVNARSACGLWPVGGLSPACSFTKDDLRDLGIYCPTAGEELQGIGCACYAQVWVDGRLMNRERPTEPFDLNSIAPEQLEALEWYASPSQTPARYSSLNSPCGVMVLWTRRH